MFEDLLELSANLLEVARAIEAAPTMTHAYVYAVEERLPIDAAKFQAQAQVNADLLESILCGDICTPHDTRTVAAVVVDWFVRFNVLSDTDLYNNDRQIMISKCKEFAYGEAF